ncbi:nucleoside-diphosphate-sugar pyrophosphorylase [Candidatus Magnetoovum chiemensis]|nr:nucleoside-diphosphate-sugar pyrophosphorylase [Candidatus Magnetoovum chiemensis]
MIKEKFNTLLISPDASIKNAMQKLNETAKKILFVVQQNNKLIGTVTDGDIRRGLINGVEFNDKVEKIMNRDFKAAVLNKTDSEENIKNLIINDKIEQVPLLNDTGTILDVFLWTDIFEENKQTKPWQLHNNQVVIMAGGIGTRMEPFTKILPKPLIPVNNKPIIEHIMERFYRFGFGKFIYTLNYKKEYMKLYLKENDYSYEIDWVEEPDYLGTAGSLSLLKDKINDTFFVTNCDSLLDIDLNDAFKWHKEHEAAMTIIGCHNEFKIPFGVLEMTNGRLNNILEKPIHDNIINTGVYIIEPHVISSIPEATPIDMNRLINIVMEKEKVSVYSIYEGWFDIGQWEEYKKSIKHFIEIYEQEK